MKTLFLLMTCALGSSSLYAQLKWDSDKLELAPAPADAFVDGKFGFVNSGKTTLTVESVQSSCGCTVPTLEKKTYASGERGELLAHFLIGDRRGVQNKSIRVQVQGERHPTVLTLIVNIPEVLRIAPLILIWEQGEPPTPKNFTLQAQANQPVMVQKVTTTNAGLSVQLDMLTEAKDYRISVTPKSTDKPDFALVTIEALVLDQRKSFPAYVQIRQKSR